MDITLNLVVQMIYNGLTMASVYILLSVGFTLVWGILGVLNFAHGHIYVLGALFAYSFMMSAGLNFYAALVASAACITVLAVGLLKGVLEPIKDFHTGAIACLGVAWALEGIGTAVFGGAVKAVPIPISGQIIVGKVVFSNARLFTLAVSLIIFALFMFLVYFTRFGRALRAIGDDAEIAAAQGINVKSISLIVFCIGTILAGASGVLSSYMTPLNPVMGFDFGLKAFVIIVLGGFGSIPGAIVGSLFLGLLESFIGTMINTIVAVIVSFALVLVVFTVRPSGLLGQPGKIP